MAQLRTRTRKSTVARRKTTTKRVTKTVLLSGLVDNISEDMALQKVLGARIKDNMVKLEAAMEKQGVRLYETEKGTGEIFTPPTRAANVIDVVKFAKKVSKKDFMATVNVPMAKAKQVLSEKELDRVTNHGQAAQKPDMLKVTPK